MEKSSLLTRILSVTGTALAWLPILAPVLFCAIALLAGRGFHFDFLMPAELFLVALIGGGLLLWAALRAHSRRRLIGWGLGLAVALLVASQALAVVTGLASGETEPGGWQMVVVIAGIAAYTLALIAIGVGGVLLLRDLFQAPRSLVK